MNTVSLEELQEYIDQAANLYNRLILLVVPYRIGKHKTIYALAQKMDCQVLNVNLELSRQMLELTNHDRRVDVRRIFENVVERVTIAKPGLGELAFIDNIEILFSPSLQTHVLNLLQSVSRRRTLISTWPGSIIDGSIVYARSGYPEYQRYPIRDFFALSVG